MKMPKKTKRQKIIAEYRRKLKSLVSSHTNEYATAQTIVENKPISTHSPNINEKTASIPKDANKTITAYFAKDAKKSFMVILFLLALEIGLYFVSINNTVYK